MNRSFTGEQRGKAIPGKWEDVECGVREDPHRQHPAGQTMLIFKHACPSQDRII